MKRKIPLIVLLVVVIAVLIVGVVLQGKYEAITSAPYVSHEAVAGTHTSARLVMKPLLAQDYIAQRLLGPQGVPEWVVGKVLPREIAVLCDANMESGDARLTLFVNDQRLGPIIQQEVNKIDFPHQVLEVSWGSPGLVRNGRGSMTLDGMMQIPPVALETIQAHWGVVQPMKPLAIAGDHLIEGVVDNRDGAGFALLGEFYLKDGAVPPNQFNILDPNFVIGVKNIACVRLTADITSLTELAVGIRVECVPSASEDAVQALKFMLDQARVTARNQVKQDFGAEMSGGFSREALAVAGQFTISPFESILKRLGVPLPPAADAA